MIIDLRGSRVKQAATVIVVILAALISVVAARAGGFVKVRNDTFEVDGKRHYFVGTNYWYGSLLALEKDPKRGIERLRRELDCLKKNGVTNLRLIAGAEGSGLLNAVERVGPPLQTSLGKFDESVLVGLDVILHEMRRREMRAVIFLSNNWEWSGGFQQYLIWSGVIDAKWLTTKPTWDELRDLTAKFYSCEPCKSAYRAQAELVITRRNSISKRRYIDDPTIFAWELANEPRPMRPAANEQYTRWIADSAAHIKSLDKNHLVTIGHEGRIGTESTELFEKIHADRNVDYLTIHIWPKNWGWLKNGNVETGYENAMRETVAYIEESATSAMRLDKPLVIEEFGLPRDNQSFEPSSTTRRRDEYFDRVLAFISNYRIVAGANFWAFGGTARPVKGQPIWKIGDERTGDPPMEEQGLNSVFDSDASTWKVIRRHAERLR